MEKIAILGAGAMGTAIAIYLAKKGHEINLWGTHIDKDIIKTMLKTRMHKSLHVALPSNIELFYADELQKALEGRKIVVLAVSSDGVPKITRKMIPFLKENMIIMNVAKGLQEDMYLTRIVVAKGGNLETVTGPAGIGDLYVTTQGGRNRTFGNYSGEACRLRKPWRTWEVRLSKGIPP